MGEGERAGPAHGSVEAFWRRLAWTALILAAVVALASVPTPGTADPEAIAVLVKLRAGESSWIRRFESLQWSWRTFGLLSPVLSTAGACFAAALVARYLFRGVRRSMDAIGPVALEDWTLRLAGLAAFLKGCHWHFVARPRMEFEVAGLAPVSTAWLAIFAWPAAAAMLAGLVRALRSRGFGNGLTVLGVLYLPLFIAEAGGLAASLRAPGVDSRTWLPGLVLGLCLVVLISVVVRARREVGTPPHTAVIPLLPASVWPCLAAAYFMAVAWDLETAWSVRLTGISLLQVPVLLVVLTSATTGVFSAFSTFAVQPPRPSPAPDPAPAGNPDAVVFRLHAGGTGFLVLIAAGLVTLDRMFRSSADIQPGDAAISLAVITAGTWALLDPMHAALRALPASRRQVP